MPLTSRRGLITSLGIGVPASLAFAGNDNSAEGDKSRAERCSQLRIAAANFEREQPIGKHPSNGDEIAYPNGVASFSKSLSHNSLGEPDSSAYKHLLNALSKADFEALESVPLGGAVKLGNPLAATAFELEGPDSHQLGMPSPPRFSSAEQAGELVELYWQALTRDIPFAAWDQDESIGAAAKDLNARQDFRGAKSGGSVTTQTLFRLGGTGVTAGPHVSQFLLLSVPYGLLSMDQLYPAALPSQQFGIDYPQWLALQNGIKPSLVTQYAGSQRIFTPRHLAEYVRRDFTFQAFLNAALILSGFGTAALSDTNPYKRSKTQTGFATFGAPQIIDCTARSANASLKAAWFPKWQVHRRLRPEEFAGRVQNNLTKKTQYPISLDLFRSSALQQMVSQNGTSLLPLGYPEGCPAHPSYPAGHATISGACITMLKAFFDESFVIPNPVDVDSTGTSVRPYSGLLTIGGELNKLASNIAMARNAAGLHWRSDSLEGIRLGEAMALGLLHELTLTTSEPSLGVRLTTFDGQPVTITPPR